MKKIILIMAAAVLALSASAQNLKFAHVNFNELVMLMPEADAARAQMEASQKEAQETYQTIPAEPGYLDCRNQGEQAEGTCRHIKQDSGV